MPKGNLLTIEERKKILSRKRLNLIGQKFGRLLVLEDVGNDKRGSSLWKCRCECGIIKILASDTLKGGATKSCGCLSSEQKHKKRENYKKINIRNLIGEKFNKWTVISDAGTNKHGHLQLECKCDCGNIKIIEKTNIVRGVSKSCGCSSIVMSKPGEVGFNKLYNRYKGRAKFLNLEFNLTKEQFKELTQQNCYYCDLPPISVSRVNRTRRTERSIINSEYLYNGVDRINNNNGYIVNNCVTCCKDCNKAKSTMEFEEFKNWVKRVYNHFINR